MWAELTELEVLQQIYGLTDGVAGKQNWRKVLALGDTLEQHLKRKLLWIWPTAVDLISLRVTLLKLNIQTVLSVGCGSGLLEWLLHAAGEEEIGIYGLEKDPSWWRSKYAVRSFIALNYIETSASDETILDARFLSNCCAGVAPAALLFCYFNNRSAFLHYISIYKGKWVVLIGPQPGQGIHTDPNPLQPQLPNNAWNLRKLLNWTEQHVVAFYERLT